MEADLKADENRKYHSTGQDECHGPVVGYSPGAVLRDLQADNADLSERATNTTRALTHVMILHPIAAGLVSFCALLAPSSLPETLCFLCRAPLTSNRRL